MSVFIDDSLCLVDEKEVWILISCMLQVIGCVSGYLTGPNLVPHKLVKVFLGDFQVLSLAILFPKLFPQHFNTIFSYLWSLSYNFMQPETYK